MAKRVTAIPIEHNYTLTEGGANTYTEVSITLPVAILGAGRVQGIELMAWRYQMPFPDPEPGQNNGVKIQLVRDSQSASIGFNNDDLIEMDEVNYDSEDATSIEMHVPQSQVRFMREQLQIVEGEGRILAERTIAIGIIGTGNATAKFTQGRLYYHIVELSAEELVAQLAMDNS